MKILILLLSIIIFNYRFNFVNSSNNNIFKSSEIFELNHNNSISSDINKFTNVSNSNFLNFEPNGNGFLISNQIFKKESNENLIINTTKSDQLYSSPISESKFLPPSKLSESNDYYDLINIPIFISAIPLLIFLV